MSFNLFASKETATGSPIFADRVFIASEGKMNACAQLAKEQPDALFIAWFGHTAGSYKAFFLQNGLAESRITLAGDISMEMQQNHLPVFLEHYPLHATEMALVENWPQKNILVYSAMDEPLFKHFGSDKMIPIIKLFGMKANAPIEHAFVTESIIKGQRKIADKVSTEIPASSQAEWMELNLSY